MTLSEFKAWFEGYTEGLEAAPTKAQFDRIKEKVKEIDGAPITHTVFVDRYWPPYYYSSTGRHYGTVGGVWLQGVGAASPQGRAQQFGQNQLAQNQFDSHSAMYALGKADALN